MSARSIQKAKIKKLSDKDLKQCVEDARSKVKFNRTIFPGVVDWGLDAFIKDLEIEILKRSNRASKTHNGETR